MDKSSPGAHSVNSMMLDRERIGKEAHGRNTVAQGIEEGHRSFAALPFKKWSLSGLAV